MNLAIVAAHGDFEQRVREAIGGLGELASLPVDTVRAGLLAPTEPTSLDVPEVIVLGDQLPVDARIDLVAEFDRRRPDVSVVMVGGQEPDLWSRALRAGARDVIAPGAPATEIRDVVKRARDTAIGRRRLAGAAAAPSPAAGPESGRIITVASPKGGCGKTTVATNLAVALAAAAPGETVLVDLDLQFGDVASSLGLDPDHHVVDAVGGLAAGDSMVLKTYLDAHPSGCYVLCAPPSPVDGEQVTAEQIAGLLRQLALGFRFVVVDTAPGLTEPTLAALEAATDHVMVAGMDVRSVRGLRKELDVLSELGIAGTRRRLVVNLVDKHSGLRLDDVQSVLDGPVAACLPRSRAAALSANRGVPLLQDRPRDPVARGLQHLADEFTDTTANRRGGKRRSRAA